MVLRIGFLLDSVKNPGRSLVSISKNKLRIFLPDSVKNPERSYMI